MKQFGFALLAFSVFGYAQGAQKPVDIRNNAEIKASTTPTPADIYCSGFITTQKVPETHLVATGQNAPDQQRYAGGSDRIFVLGAADLKAGDRLLIVRHVHNPNEYERYRGEHALIKQTGEPYFERGYVRVLEVQKNVAITKPELSCADMMAGDIAIPLVEREKPTVKAVPLDRYTAPTGKASGRIVMANEFDASVSTGEKVYLSIGEDKGLKVGDYLRATRTYDYSYRERESGLSGYASDLEDTMYREPKFPKDYLKQLPRLTLGDMVVLTVHSRSATAMIVTALEDIRVGDGVELMDTSNTSGAAAADAPTTAQAAAPKQ